MEAVDVVDVGARFFVVILPMVLLRLDLESSLVPVVLVVLLTGGEVGTLTSLLVVDAGDVVAPLVAAAELLLLLIPYIS